MADKKAAVKKSKNSNKILLGMIIGFVLITVFYVLMRFVFFRENRDPKGVAESAFAAVYGVDFEDFKKASIYNDACQKYLRMEMAWEIDQIEKEFEVMKGESDAFSMKINSTEVIEFQKGSEGYEEGIRLLLQSHAETLTTDISKVALANISYSLTYKDEEGEEKEDGVEEYWLYQIKGAWYAHPLVNTLEEGMLE
ncbi:MAG: hypothetical protein MJ064_03090 [Lachnospiraceae bacterium]|nr:hypothetical protein [Lachnospiraceae bacterium]